jgi:N-acetyl sugar amidotransferase
LLLDKSLDRQVINSNTVKFCKKCVMSNQRPRLKFDKNGICSACNYAEIKNNEIDWDLRKKKLVDLLDKHRSNDGSYDCIVPGSGGKDSSFVAHKLKYEYGMHPLTITWAPFIYTDIGWQNYLAFKDSGFDNMLFFPNGIIHRKLSRLAFELVGDNFLPFIYGQKAYAFNIAVKHKIPLIFYGESGEVEYGGNTKNIDKSHENVDDWKELYFKSSSLDDLVNSGLQNNILNNEEISNNALDFYRAPSIEKIEENNTQMHWFSFYEKWLPQENYYYACENTGFIANPGRSEGTYSKYASLDDKTDGFHFYMAYIKFGFGRATSDAAHEIREGYISREEAVSLVDRYDGEFPEKYFQEFLNYINIDEEYFFKIIDFYRKRSPHIWTNTNNGWKLRHTVSGNGVDD